MHNAAAMRLVEGVGDLDGERQRLLEGEASGLQPLRQCGALEALHHEIVDGLVRPDVVHVQIWGWFRLPACALPARGAAAVPDRRPAPQAALDDDGPAEAGIGRAIHLAHAAFAQLAEDSIRTKHPPDHVTPSPCLRVGLGAVRCSGGSCRQGRPAAGRG